MPFLDINNEETGMVEEDTELRPKFKKKKKSRLFGDTKKIWSLPHIVEQSQDLLLNLIFSKAEFHCITSLQAKKEAENYWTLI